MSFTQIKQVPVRLNRSQRFVLSTDTSDIEAAAGSEADVVFFELEDAVVPEQKALGRKNVVEALNDLDWGPKTVSMRINGLDSPHMHRDLVDVLEGPSERLDLVLIPKAGTASDIYAVDVLVTQIEQATGREKRLGLEVMIETAQGMTNIDEKEKRRDVASVVRGFGGRVVFRRIRRHSRTDSGLALKHRQHLRVLSPAAAHAAMPRHTRSGLYFGCPGRSGCPAGPVLCCTRTSSSSVSGR